MTVRHLYRTVERVLFPFGRGNITRLGLAYFFSTLYFYIPVGTLYLQTKNLDYVQINSLWGIIVFTQFLAEVPTGILADRIGRKRAINFALGLQWVGEVIYVFARGYPGFVLSAIAGGLGFAFGSGCVESLVYDSLVQQGNEHEMSRAMGYIQAAQRLANLVAFTAGAVLIQNLTQERFVLAIVCTACMVGIGFLLSLSLEKPNGANHKLDQAPANSLRLLSDGIRLLEQNRLFRRLVWLALFTIPFKDYLGSLYQPHFVAAQVNPVWFGLSLSIASGVSILGARYAYLLERHLGSTAGLLVATALPGLLYVLMAVLLHPVFSVLAFCLLYGSMSLRDPILAGQLNRHIESQNRATVLSLVSMFSGLYVALLGIIIGAAANRSVPTAFVLTGAIVLCGTMLFRPPVVPDLEQSP
jgi:MFS family permease